MAIATRITVLGHRLASIAPEPEFAGRSPHCTPAQIQSPGDFRWAGCGGGKSTEASSFLLTFSRLRRRV